MNSHFKPWMWAGFAVIFLGLLPVWPVSGMVWGLPVWAILAVAMSVVFSGFIVLVIHKAWPDTDGDGNG